jgi:hypothetical protein
MKHLLIPPLCHINHILVIAEQLLDNSLSYRHNILWNKSRLIVINCGDEVTSNC